jgi:hypothetical protein
MVDYIRMRDSEDHKMKDPRMKNPTIIDPTMIDNTKIVRLYGDSRIMR